MKWTNRRIRKAICSQRYERADYLNSDSWRRFYRRQASLGFPVLRSALDYLLPKSLVGDPGNYNYAATRTETQAVTGR